LLLRADPLQPTTLKAPFLEQFTDDWDTRWKPSHAKKEKDKTSTSEDEWAYIGNWAVEEPTVLNGMEGDKGLIVKDKAAHHAISAKFPKAINPKGKPLVVQYEVKLQGMYYTTPYRIAKTNLAQTALSVVVHT
jgi:calnexin